MDVLSAASHDTSQFAIDSLLEWWRLHDRQQYLQARELLLLCDGGGSNGRRVWAFKVELQRFADVTGWTVRVALSALPIEVQPDRTRDVPAR
jgi:hypothetical protein